MTRFAIRAALTAFAVLAGCGGGGDSVSDKLDEQEDLTRSAIEVICDCNEDAAMRQECLDGLFEPYTASERTCIVDALEMDADASKQALDCTNDVAADLLDCIETNINCDDLQATITACQSIADRADSCTLPAGVEAAVNACTAE